MPFTYEGDQLLLTPVFAPLLALDCAFVLLLTIFFVYLVSQKHKIPQKIMLAIQLCTIIGILTMSSFAWQCWDDSPPFVAWLGQFLTFLGLFIIGMVSLELFKTFSVMGHYYTPEGIYTMQKFWCASYAICAACQCAILPSLGHKTITWILLVYHL